MKMDTAVVLSSPTRVPAKLIVMGFFVARLCASQEAPPLAAVLNGLSGRAVSEIWSAVEELKRLHEADAEAFRWLSNTLGSLPDRARLAGAALLYARKEPAYQQDGQVAIQRLTRDSSETEVRIAAIRLLKKPVQFNEAFLTLKDVAKSATDPRVKIEATLALWELDNQPALRTPLINLLADERVDVRNMTALALAETGYYETSVEERLRSIAREPTDLGRYARALLRSVDRHSTEETPRATTTTPRTPETKPGQPAAGNGGGNPALADRPTWATLLAAVEGILLKSSLYRDRIGTRDLYLAAIRGMVSSLDEYSVFQDPDELHQAEAGRLGTFWGLCADLVKPGKTAPLLVARPHRGGPAFEAGLRSGDQILEVNGVTTHDRNRSELERLTSGSEGDEIQLRVARLGWSESQMIRVKRGRVEIPSVQSVRLPEGIGYIKLSRVGPTSATEFEDSLDEIEKAGLDALVIDLRDNRGGNLKQAVRIVDLFIGESTLPIVTERSPGRTTEWSSSPEEKPRHPTAIVVNHLTASAAEVIAGSLQDFRRAFLVGDRTFGKGVKQVSFPLPPEFTEILGGESRLLITTGRLYLPSGRPIQPENARTPSTEGGGLTGLEPDIPVEDSGKRFEGRRLTEVLRVQYSPQVIGYVHQNFTALKSIFLKSDIWNPTQCPDFEALYQSLGTRLSHSEVLHAIKGLLRRQLEDEAAEETICNYRDDPTLARAILELFRRIGRDAAQSPEYRGLAEEGTRRNVKEE